MNKLRTLLAAAVTAAALTGAALTPASAHFHPTRGFGQYHGRTHFHFHERFHFHAHWRFRFHEHARWGLGHHWCFHWRHCGPYGGWRTHYHYSVGYGAPSVAVAAAPVCPVGTHLGYLGKHCWPNRR